MHHSYTKGFGMIEILVGSAIILASMLALSSAYSAYVKYALANDKNVQATYLAQEGLEGLTFLRDKSWSTYILPLSTTTTYYLTWDSTNAYWKATTTAQYIDSTFLRQFIVSDVQRNSSGYIVSSGGTYDSNTKQISMTVSYYQGHATSTETVLTYLTNLYTN